MCDAIELAYDALFHFSCGLVGEGYSQYVTIVFGLLNEQTDEVDC